MIPDSDTFCYYFQTWLTTCFKSDRGRSRIKWSDVSYLKDANEWRGDDDGVSHVQIGMGSRSEVRDLHVQLELGWDFGQYPQSAAFWKELDLLFLKTPRFSKSVEK